MFNYADKDRDGRINFEEFLMKVPDAPIIYAKPKQQNKNTDLVNGRTDKEDQTDLPTQTQDMSGLVCADPLMAGLTLAEMENTTIAKNAPINTKNTEEEKKQAVNKITDDNITNSPIKTKPPGIATPPRLMTF